MHSFFIICTNDLLQNIVLKIFIRSKCSYLQSTYSALNAVFRYIHTLSALPVNKQAKKCACVCL